MCCFCGQVHLYKHGKAGTKLKVSVDVEQGKLFAVKEKGSQLDETNVFSSDQSRLSDLI